MSDERRRATRYPVAWRGRALLADRSVYNIKIQDISKGGAAILFEHALPVKTPINIEMTVPTVRGRTRLRAKAVVAHVTVMASGMAALGLLFVAMSETDSHALSNILQGFSEKQE